MIKFRHRGDFHETEKFLSSVKRIDPRRIIEKYGSIGVSALKANTPKDSGETSSSWDYEIVQQRNGFKISWTNSNIVYGIPVAILIQYGHGTRGGTYVEGRDFINPAMRPIFDKIAENLWKEVSGL